MADPLLSSAPQEGVSLANDYDPTKTFPNYKSLLKATAEVKRLQSIIDKQTLELAEAKKAPPGDFQRAHIHQINNILFRSGYELDQNIEETKRACQACVEELQIDWGRIKSNWVQNEDQIFQLIVIFAKCEFLRATAKDVDAAKEILAPLEGLLEEINRFASAHLSSGTLPDSPLDFMRQMVGRVGEVLGGAYDIATEIPDWRGNLAEPQPGTLSAKMLNESQAKIKNRMNEIPTEISRVQRLLPEGNWRRENDLRQEIYAFAEILIPNSPLQRIPVKETLQYLDNNPDSRLRRVQMDKLKNDSAKCKAWLETREHHELMLEQSIGLAKEGNYLQAEEFMSQNPPYFNDLDYKKYEETAKYWHDQRDQLRQRLVDQLKETEQKLEHVFRNPWIPLPRTVPMKIMIGSLNASLAREREAVAKYSKTDYFKDVQPILDDAEASIQKLEKWAIRKRNFCWKISFLEACVFAGLFGSALAGYLHNVKMSQSSLIVQVVPGAENEAPPRIELRSTTSDISASTTAFEHTFERMRAGDYRLEISAPGYFPQTFQVALEPGKRLTWNPVKLRPIRGFLRFEPALGDYNFDIRAIRTDGSIGESVHLGMVTGTESKNIGLRPGRYWVTFIQDQNSFEIPLQVEAHQILEYTPNFMFTTLIITSDPVGAEVLIDGAPVGKTPFTTRLAPINYSIGVVKEGYEPHYMPVQLPPGSKTPVHIPLRVKPLAPPEWSPVVESAMPAPIAPPQAVN